MIRITLFGPRPVALAAAAAGAGGALLLAACASSPPSPDVALGEARQAIAVAERAHVPDSAAPELAEARARLASADHSALLGHRVEALRLAQESRADAELAYALSTVARDQAVNDELLRNSSDLSGEMQRNTGATQ